MPAHHEFQSAFRAGLIMGRRPQDMIAEPDEADRRFAVYRNNVVVSLTNALSKRFAVIERLVGGAFFAALAQTYLQAHRPRSPVLHEWGDTFPAFLAGFPPLAAYPYLADVARIELARGRAYHAADAAPVLPERLAAAAVDAGRTRLGLHSSVQILTLSHPAVTIWATNQPGMTARQPITTSAEIALVLRDRAYQVQVAALAPGDAAMIVAMLAGATLMDAATAGATADRGHDPQPVLVRLMQAGVIISAGEPS